MESRNGPQRGRWRPPRPGRGRGDTSSARKTSPQSSSYARPQGMSEEGMQYAGMPSPYYPSATFAQSQRPPYMQSYGYSGPYAHAATAGSFQQPINPQQAFRAQQHRVLPGPLPQAPFVPSHGAYPSYPYNQHTAQGASSSSSRAQDFDGGPDARQGEILIQQSMPGDESLGYHPASREGIDAQQFYHPPSSMATAQMFNHSQIMPMYYGPPSTQYPAMGYGSVMSGYAAAQMAPPSSQEAYLAGQHDSFARAAQGGARRPTPRNTGSAASQPPRGSATNSGQSPNSSSSSPQKGRGKGGSGDGAHASSAQRSRDARQASTSHSERTEQTRVPRSEHVMWCGNVPADATTEELQEKFSEVPRESTSERDQDEQVDGHGILSVFIISRSNCAFVNYATPEHLERAVRHLNGMQLRGPRGPSLVCRVRRRDDEVQAGVAGQRNHGIHSAWLREHTRRAKEQAFADAGEQTPTLVGEGGAQESEAHPVKSKDTLDDITAGVDALQTHTQTPKPRNAITAISAQALASTAGNDLRPQSLESTSNSVSYASTNSSLLRHPLFRERFFILKSRSVEELDKSVATGLWATQPHNEAVLDQAFRNSETVYLIFSANQSGGFYGYAKMTGAIVAQGQLPSESRNIASIPEDDEKDSSEMKTREGVERPSIVLTQEPAPLQRDTSSTSLRLQPTSSPLQMTPSSETDEADLLLKVSQGTVNELKGQHTIMPASPNPDYEHDVESAETNTPHRSKGSTSSEPSIRAAMSAKAIMDEHSIYPSDSASYPPEARSLQQLAYRALIHNLRLDEREERAHREHAGKDESLEEREEKVKDADHLDAPETDTALATNTASLGTPFQIEWLVTLPLSFHAVRKLRNPWRVNRQIKVSRDGTEVEPHVGRELLEIWSEEEKRLGVRGKNAAEQAP